MKPILKALTTCLLLCVQTHAADATTQKPNILLILADDLGYADLGCQGAKDIPTPHIDSLAKNGIRCTSGYVSAPMCSPSRAGLMTGRSQSRFGHEINWVNSVPNDPRGLPLTEKTFADHLKAADYHTGAVGKWHLGDAPPRQPNQRGFDEFFGFLGGGHQYLCENLRPNLFPGRSRSWEYFSLLERNGKPERKGGYLTEVLGRECAGFISRSKDQPWFLYAAFNAPHGPYQATPALLERVKGLADEGRRTYAAMVVGLDDAVGAILAQLRADGIEERTLIFFLSDNGGPLAPRSAALNTPLNGQKGNMWEGGIRVPFLVQWKGTLPAGTTYDRPVSSLDLLPTSLAAAGAKSIATQPLDGVDLLPFLKGERRGDPHEWLLWRMKARSIWAVRRGDEKLVMQKTKAPRLFDLAADIGETTDLAGKQATKRDELQRAYDAWNATLPEPLWDVVDEDEKPAPKKTSNKKTPAP